MRLLVLAQTPPPVHGQSLMVRTLLEGLPSVAPEIFVQHVNLDLSHSAFDVGRWQTAKLFRLRHARHAALQAQRNHNLDTLYYVPAPGKTSAVLRDILLLPRLRRAFPRLILHWHASGLGAWSQDSLWAGPLQRALTEADLAIVPSTSLRADASVFRPRTLVAIDNGIDAPVPPAPVPRVGCHFVFLGLLERSKGVLDLIEAFQRAHPNLPEGSTLTFAGASGENRTVRALEKACQSTPAIRYAGFVVGAAKQALLQGADVVCLPTHYPHEAQPLAALEALAWDKKVVASQWRGLPDTLHGSDHWLHHPHDQEGLCRALLEASKAPPPGGRNRAAYEARFTREHHLGSLASALRQL